VGRISRCIGGRIDFDELEKLIYALLEGVCSETAEGDETECSTLNMDMSKDHE
jgi:hypothetical protein